MPLQGFEHRINVLGSQFKIGHSGCYAMLKTDCGRHKRNTINAIADFIGLAYKILLSRIM